jgi:hypothetical protein
LDLRGRRSRIYADSQQGRLKIVWSKIAPLVQTLMRAADRRQVRRDRYK